MARKKTKRKRNKVFQDEKPKQPEHRTLQVREIFKREKYFIAILLALGLVVYFKSLFNDFVILDDLDTYVNSPFVRDFVGSLKTLQIQGILYAIFFKIWGPENALPLHITSVGMHLAIAALSFVSMYILFGKKVAKLASLIFVVLPATSEAVLWISASTYLYVTLFTQIVLITYLIHKRTGEMKDLLLSVGLYGFFLIINKSQWMALIPFLILLLDQFVYQDKFSLESLNNWLIFIVPLGLYILIFMSGWIASRLESRKPETVNTEQRITGKYQNQEALTPIVEGWPYSTYSMVRIYTAPVMLSSMYDGKPVERNEYIIMYVVTAFYFSTATYIFYRNKKYGILFVILPMLIVPVYSPNKVTWYMAERYLYPGTIYFSVLAAAGILEFSKFINKKYLNDKGKMEILVVSITGIVLVLFGLRTFIRIEDWSSSVKFSEALIETAPQSARTWSFMGSSLLMLGDEQRALINYDKALQIDYMTNSAANNIGVLLIKNGPDYWQERYKFTDTLNKAGENNLILGLDFANQRLDPRAMFLLVDYLHDNPNNVQALTKVSEIYIRNGYPSYGEEVLQKALDLNPNNAAAWLNYAFIQFQRQNFDVAEQYVNNAYQIEPSNPAIQQYYTAIQDARQKAARGELPPPPKEQPETILQFQGINN